VVWRIWWRLELERHRFVRQRSKGLLEWILIWKWVSFKSNRKRVQIFNRNWNWVWVWEWVRKCRCKGSQALRKSSEHAQRISS
jgi:hypothetical protein